MGYAALQCSKCSQQASGTVGQLAVATALLPEAKKIVGGLSLSSVTDLFGSNPYAGGADPCCPPGFNAPTPWPINAGMDGAPPDYRTNAAPMTSMSALGHGRNKDRLCDCLPFWTSKRLWTTGYVDSSGTVQLGAAPAQYLKNVVYVEIASSGQAPTGLPTSPMRILSVPGVHLATPATPTSPPTVATAVVPSQAQNVAAATTAASAAAPSSAAAKVLTWGGIGLVGAKLLGLFGR